MKYILNEIPVRTTNNFKINDIEIDLNLPSNLNFKKFKTTNTDNIKINYSEISNFTSKIGLSLPKALNLDINITKKIEDPIILTYEFNDDNLIDNINMDLEENASANIILKYISTSNNKNFHHLKLNINLLKYANLNITIINMLNKESISLIASESKVLEHANLNQNLIDLNSSIKIDNYYSIVDSYGKSTLNNIYLGKDNDIIDLNYNYINKGNNSITDILSEGTLNDKAIKKFRGTIDFKKGATCSIGKEKENCVLLSDNCISRSVPLLLCGEENVEGAHAVSSGKIDDDKLFYLTSRGISKEDAIKMIIEANFNKVLDNIDNTELKEEILEYIDNLFKQENN